MHRLGTWMEWDEPLFYPTKYFRSNYKCLFCKKIREVEVPNPSWSSFLLVAAFCPANHPKLAAFNSPIKFRSSKYSPQEIFCTTNPTIVLNLLVNEELIRYTVCETDIIQPHSARRVRGPESLGQHFPIAGITKWRGKTRKSLRKKRNPPHSIADSQFFTFVFLQHVHPIRRTRSPVPLRN